MAVKLAGDTSSFGTIFRNANFSTNLSTLSSKLGGTTKAGQNPAFKIISTTFSSTNLSKFGKGEGFAKFQTASKNFGGILGGVAEAGGDVSTIMKAFPDGVMTSMLKNMETADATKILKKMDPEDAAGLFKNIDLDDTASMLKKLDDADASKIIKNMDETKRADIATKMGKKWDKQTLALVAAAGVTVVVGAGLIGKAEEERKKAIKECKEQCIPEGWGTGPSPELKYKKLDESDHGIVCTPEQDDCEKYCDDECNEKYKDFGSAGLGDDTEDFFNKMFKNLNPLNWFNEMQDWMAWFLRIFIFIISFLLCGGCLFMLIKAFT